MKKPYVLLFQLNILAEDRESAFEEAVLLSHELTDKITGFMAPVLIHAVTEAMGENHLEFIAKCEETPL